MKKRIYTLFVSLLACILSANAGLSKTDYSSNNYINEWGRLKLVGNQLSSQNGDTIQMRGVSTFSLNFNEVLPCLTKEGFSALKKWGCNVVRLAQYPQSSMNTYDETTATKVEYYIKMCNELGMYAIVDWNIFEYEGMEGNPIKFKDEAKDFFSKISEFVYANNYKNVIYEICSEPSVSWENVIKYADYILPVIEKNDPQAIVIVGTPEASTDFTDVIDNPIEYKNLGIMYAYHHSVCDSESRLESVKKAAKELPIFVSEWWPTDVNGDGPICTDKSDKFIDFLENGTSQAISWTYWAFGEKQEPSHMMTRCYFDDEDSNVSNAGKYIIPKFGYVQKPVVKPFEYKDYSSYNYINMWGRLKLVGNQLSSQNGDTIQMRGVSTFSLNFNEVLPCLTKEGFSALKKWGCNVVRLAQYPQSSMNTYDETTATKVEYYIKMCNELGMYAIVDWHIFEYEGMEGNPIKFKDEAKDFFSKISEFVYANNYKNVIYEICSDPSVSWENIIKYADYILPVIEKNDPQAIVIVGTPEASTDFTDVIDNPIEYKNLGIMYAYHHSVCDSESRLENVKKAAKELPIFVSEWWPTDVNGDGPICTDKSDDFIDFLENGTSQAISWTYWAFGEKQEPSHMMTRCYFDDEDSNVSNAGKYIIPKFGYVQKPVVKPFEYKDYSSYNYIDMWGRLKLVGNQLSAQNGDTIQMRGVSTFSLNYPEVLPCLNKDGFSALKKWGCNVVRLAQYPQSSTNMYDSSAVANVKKYIDICNDLGMYVIVDWNIMNAEDMEGNPAKFQDKAKDFFTKISEYVRSKKYINVIYEICSEPNVSWDEISNYAKNILQIIEKNDSGAIVIVGTPEASSDFTDVVENPIKNDALGIMYAYHHSVCDSESRLTSVKNAAMKLPIFVSEWWPSDLNDGIDICTDKSDDFIKFLEYGTRQAISWTYWAFGEKNEPSHMMNRCIFDENDSYISDAGKYIISKFGYVQKKHTDLAPEIDCDETFPEIKILLKEDECSLSYDQMPFKINSIPVNPYTDEKAVVDTVRNDKNKITDPYFPGKYTIQWTFRYPSSELKTICNQTIDITDTIAPDFDCNSLPSTIKLYIADDAQTATYEQIKDAGFSIPQVYDKCDDAIVNVTREDGAKLDSVYPIGTTAISIKITDRYGNAVYCKQKIDIKKAIKHIDCDKMYPSVVLYTDSCSKSYDIEPIYINDSTDKFTFEASRTSGEDIEKPYYIGCDTINLKFIFESGSTEVCKQAICVKQTYKINCVKTDTIWFEKDNEDVFIPSDKLLPCIIDECTGEKFCPKITRSDSLAISDPLQVGETIINYTYTDHNEGEIYCEQVIIVIDNLTSIDNTDVDAIISVVPNPSNGQFEISVSEPSNISIFNSIGQKVFEKAIEDKFVMTKPFGPGIYSVKAESKKSVRIIKLIVVK